MARENARGSLMLDRITLDRINMLVHELYAMQRKAAEVAAEIDRVCGELRSLGMEPAKKVEGADAAPANITNPVSSTDMAALARSLPPPIRRRA